MSEWVSEWNNMVAKQKFSFAFQFVSDE
jgi:hypothetical protein